MTPSMQFAMDFLRANPTADYTALMTAAMKAGLKMAPVVFGKARKALATPGEETVTAPATTGRQRRRRRQLTDVPPPIVTTAVELTGEPLAFVDAVNNGCGVSAVYSAGRWRLTATLTLSHGNAGGAVEVA